jgi:hypothetical protein
MAVHKNYLECTINATQKRYKKRYDLLNPGDVQESVSSSLNLCYLEFFNSLDSYLPRFYNPSQASHAIIVPDMAQPTKALCQEQFLIIVLIGATLTPIKFRFWCCAQ